MALRIERQVQNCGKIAEYLAKHPLVKKINYAGLATHPGHDLHFKQATGAGSLLSFETGAQQQSGRTQRRNVLQCGMV